jgi:hypothetical protein
LNPEKKMDRRVTATKRDRSGRIIALCNPAEKWSPRRSADVVKDIQSNKKSYYVEEVPRRKYVRVVSGGLLQTTSDATSQNSLDRLPGA